MALRRSAGRAVSLGRPESRGAVCRSADRGVLHGAAAHGVLDGSERAGGHAGHAAGGGQLEHSLPGEAAPVHIITDTGVGVADRGRPPAADAVGVDPDPSYRLVDQPARRLLGVAGSAGAAHYWHGSGASARARKRRNAALRVIVSWLRVS